MSEDGFLGRWSRRKEAVREGKEVEPPPAAAPEEAAPAAPVEAPPPPPPTLEDVEALTPQSDFQRFVAPGVPADVKNAAVKKLFSDPHFNVMDGLDTYIDDYNKPDPLPAEMLRKLVSAQFLDLFDERKNAKAQEEGEDATQPPPPPQAQGEDD
ncbi:MAG: DUF3306 domain-containing protein [Burkholderiales bacterium]|nr:DUF3306 domain-containing protein [Burkholderiales bacterium]